MRIANRLRVTLSFVLCYAMVLAVLPVMPVERVHAQNISSAALGRVVATNYNRWSILVTAGTASGAGTVTAATAVASLPDGAQFIPFATTAPVQINDGANTETVTPSGVSNCNFGALQSTCQVTATWSNAHGTGTRLVSGTFGLQEAINDLKNRYTAGGIVVVDGGFGGTTSTITSAVGSLTVAIEDLRSGRPIYYTYNGTAYVAMNNVSTSVVTLTNPQSLTNLMTLAQPAGAYNVAGRTLRFQGEGTYTTVGTTPTVQLALIIGSTDVCTATSGATTSGVGPFNWKFTGIVTTVATGATGTVEAHCELSIALGASQTSQTVYHDNNTAVSGTFDLTAANTIAFQATLNSSNGGNRVAQRQMLLEPIN